MIPKRLEVQTINLLNLIDSDFGQSGRDVRLLAIRDELISVFHEGMEEAAKICDYREDLQIKTCGDDRAIEAKCCAEDIREAKDKL